MCKHEDKFCPRCHVKFECKVGNITQCQCYGIELKNEEQAFISSKYNDCLCANCIKEIRTEFNINKFAAKIKALRQ
ncbi:MAG: cysteine-rich CWC family protein [Ferruginibacter sp.]